MPDVSSSEFTRRGLFQFAVVLGASAAPLALTAGASAPTMRSLEPLPSASTPAFAYGPTGKHWPQRTPALRGPFSRTIEVAATWGAIADGIKEAVKYPSQQVRIAVRPGSLGGNGNGSGSTPVLSGVGALGRSSRILIVPRDGGHTVRFTNSIRLLNIRGVTFAGFSIFPHSLNLSGVQDFGWAYSKGLNFNISGRGQTTENIDLVECVTPNSGLREYDTWAIRSGTHEVRNIKLDGCYVAPSYKAAGSSAHVDSIQISGDLPQSNITISGTAIFASTNVGVIPSSTARNVLFDGSLVVAADRMLLRFPLPAGANKFTSGYPTAVNGIGTTNILSSKNSVFVGNVRGTWASATNTQVMAAPDSRANSGGFTVTPSLASINAAWINARVAIPDDTYLKSIWSAARA